MALQYIIAPRYGCHFAAKKGELGKFMWVVLGPGDIENMIGSEFGGGRIRRFGLWTPRRNAGGWIAGHMLNRDFGGNGESKNFVPLTGLANHFHSSYENAIKRCHINRIQQLTGDDANYIYGIYYSVTTSDKSFLRGTYNRLQPLSRTPSHITLDIRVVRQNRNDVNDIQEIKRDMYAEFNGGLNSRNPKYRLPLQKEIHNTADGADMKGIIDEQVVRTPKRRVKFYLR